ncbi:starch synthase [Cruoricaptor ignavus]|uniref:Glycogen synthase n=1 Tax=Cruoricaptor ignavus TaxID=1118202 RepID=A0A1M6CCT7_9FLAO|nr:glycogen/starch synthase [Cruoricaptor ignavus]SHI58528.1 starch synthase [Cruoricaptor ignavus]
MRIFHLSMECYPVAKVGGLADVVGALPKYQNKKDGVEASVVMPWYNRPFVWENEFDVVFDGFIHQSHNMYQVQVFRERHRTLGFDLYLVKIPGLLDREKPYGYWDEQQQFLAFQHGALHWLSAMQIRPDVLHCHDYHTGLVPFMIEYCGEFSFLKGVKTIGTIHNGEYQGWMDWRMANFMPWFDGYKWGLLDWHGKINPLAAMIKCCNAFNAVSGGYMQELYHNFQSLEPLVWQESQKAFGIINGIDTEVWNTETDGFLEFNFSKENFKEGKRLNKQALCREYNLREDLPLIAFIGRFAGEKGADLLPEIAQRIIRETEGGVNVMILGSGNTEIENHLRWMDGVFVNFAVDLGYKEFLSHRIYASADFLLMPSRVEPCGLNQMYAMRYGTIPVVSYTGGLRDTVQDVTSGGAGINFTNAGVDDAVHALHRAREIYYHHDYMDGLIRTNMNFDFSWDKSAENYLSLYQY